MLGPDKRDGSCPDRAVIVSSIPDEYAWFQHRYCGFTLHHQRLEYIGDKPHDILTFRNLEGEELTVYFDVSQFFGVTE